MTKCCLTIAGSDSGGNAGVQADLRTFHAYGVHGCTAFTALTAQNPHGVAAIHQVPADFIAAQLDAVLGVYSIGAIKTGMLGPAAAIRTIAGRLAALTDVPKVVDPVMVATSGARLVADDARAALAEALLPIATLATPNLPEAEVLAGVADRGGAAAREASADRAAELAKIIHGRFGCAVLVKGGHGHGNGATDVLFDGHETHRFSLPWIENPVSTHGTGCSLAAAIAAELALGRNLAEAVAGAKRYVHAAIAASSYVGPGCGVLGFVGQPGSPASGNGAPAAL